MLLKGGEFHNLCGGLQYPLSPRRSGVGDFIWYDGYMVKEKVLEKLKENNLKWSDFMKWMYGQTMGLNEDGTPDYYDWDVERFIRNHAK